VASGSRARGPLSGGGTASPCTAGPTGNLPRPVPTGPPVRAPPRSTTRRARARILLHRCCDPARPGAESFPRAPEVSVRGLLAARVNRRLGETSPGSLVREPQLRRGPSRRGGPAGRWRRRRAFAEHAATPAGPWGVPANSAPARRHKPRPSTVERLSPRPGTVAGRAFEVDTRKTPKCAKVDTPIQSGGHNRFSKPAGPARSREGPSKSPAAVPVATADRPCRPWFVPRATLARLPVVLTMCVARIRPGGVGKKPPRTPRCETAAAQRSLARGRCRLG